jgi:hypothetical protein
MMIGAKPLILGKLKENKGVVISSLFYIFLCRFFG